jgi:EAL domain-containing protein (putative c-di-GMP-specific phosphodiesterase class I)
MDYQAIVDSRSGEVWMYEALMRLELPPGRERIYPPQFLQSVEEDGTILELGIQCIEQAHDWQERWGFPVAVNLSLQQMTDPRLLPAIDTHRIYAVEMTEHLVLGEVAENAANALDDMGVLVVLDDFGAGHSNMEALTRMTGVSVLKIDKSIVQSEGGHRREVMNAIVELARAMDMKTVAEGVETDQHAICAIFSGVDFLQGRGIAKESTMPLSQREASALTSRVPALNAQALAGRGEPQI